MVCFKCVLRQHIHTLSVSPFLNKPPWHQQTPIHTVLEFVVHHTGWTHVNMCVSFPFFCLCECSWILCFQQWLFALPPFSHPQRGMYYIRTVVDTLNKLDVHFRVWWVLFLNLCCNLIRARLSKSICVSVVDTHSRIPTAALTPTQWAILTVQCRETYSVILCPLRCNRFCSNDVLGLFAKHDPFLVS